MTSKVAKALNENPDPRDIVDDLTMGRYGFFLAVSGLVAIMSMVPIAQVIYIAFIYPRYI
jgi:hypothetical protein